MTDTTSLKLPASLKERILPLARAAGKTPHAWMVGALEAQVELAGLRRAFIEEARAVAAEIDAAGPLYAMEDVAAYMRARAAGVASARPAPVPAVRRGGTNRTGKGAAGKRR